MRDSHNNTVTLGADGRSVSSYSPEWRKETFEREMMARRVCKILSLEGRRSTINQYKDRHTEVEVSRLLAEIQRIWSRK